MTFNLDWRCSRYFRRARRIWLGGAFVFVCCVLLTPIAHATLTKLHDFQSATDGSASVDDIAMDGSRLFGSTWVGGSTGGGTIWAFDTSINQFTNLHNFTNADGTGPISGVALSSNKLFGTTYLGGAHSGGTIWSFDLASNSFSKLHDFTTSEGTFSNGGALVGGSTLYGTTRLGGQYGRGSIWKINTSGGGFTKLHDFEESGSVGGLVISGNRLFGTTYTDGPSHHGSAWSLRLDTLAFNTLNIFNGFSEGSSVIGDVVLNGTKLIGTTGDGGGTGQGTIWSVDVDNGAYSLLHSFTSGEGRSSRMAPMIVGGKIIGVGFDGGSNGDGTLWSMDLASQAFTKLEDFNYPSSGASPNGGIVIQNGVIFGTAKEGGITGDGTIWRTAIPEPSAIVLSWGGYAGLLMAAASRRRK